MNQPNNQELLRQIAILNNEIKHFDFTKPIDEQNKEVAQIAKSVNNIAKQLPLTETVEVGGDLVTVGECAVNPVNIITCLRAILAIIDLVRVLANQKNG
jgi:hypothetical protein